MRTSLKVLKYMTRCKKKNIFVKKQELFSRYNESVISELCYYDYLENISPDGIQITFPGENYYRNEREKKRNLVITLVTLIVSILGVLLQLVLAYWPLPL